ncbi:hypothetical protein GCK72_011525 [Caenorhabditis remanei]|uniref:Uncharacterized protein n=1 Tax=Caenorhabditis remanei TaxID=31234 RepID=A0A6A5H875_CAERE|nr:hypothetical protein GCK72_011525 [Caenorhabditis remanei]KAF1763259.1 hypothetical protein GCK72_011525 [Caenorhabditis remanei]
MRLLLAIGCLALLLATVLSAPSGKEHTVSEWAPEHGPFGVEKDGVVEVDGPDHSRSKRWGGWGWGRPYGMGWGRPWGWRRPWGGGWGGYGGYGGYGWGR